MRISARWAARVILALGIAGAGPLSAQKTDVVILQNNDEITGEIKKLERGKLEYSTDDMGRVYIEWTKIDGLTSKDYFEVELASGRKYYGTIPPAAEARKMVVFLFVGDTLDMASVVLITPIETGFWDRTRGFIDFGFNLTQANKQAEVTFGGEAAYRGRKWGVTLTGTSYFRFQEATDNTSRNSLGLDVHRFFAHRWAASVVTQSEQNQELGLDLRLYGGGSAIRRLVQTNSVTFQVTGGAVVTREQFTGADSAVYSAEATLGGRFEAFRFDTPELDVTANLSSFTSITDLGRFRIDLDVRVQYEVWSDFFVGLTAFEKFDSRPPAVDAAKNDFGVSFTVGWSWN